MRIWKISIPILTFVLSACLWALSCHAQTADPISDQIEVGIVPSQDCLKKSANQQWEPQEYWAWGQICAHKSIDLSNYWHSAHPGSDASAVPVEARTLSESFLRQIFEDENLSPETRDKRVRIVGATIPQFVAQDLTIGSLEFVNCPHRERTIPSRFDNKL